MTVTESPPARPKHGGAWTIEDLVDLTDDDNRYEILDGSLLVTPPADSFHFSAATELDHLLMRSAPPHLVASAAGLGINIRHRSTYYIPDIIVVERAALKADVLAIEPSAVRLVVEVLSPSNARHDLVNKRRDYAMAGIPQYWIVDHRAQTLTVFVLDDTGERYAEPTVVRPGRAWKTEEPFPVTLDLAEIF